MNYTILYLSSQVTCQLGHQRPSKTIKDVYLRDKFAFIYLLRVLFTTEVKGKGSMICTIH